MNLNRKKVLDYVGLDSAVFFTVLGRGLQICTSFMTVFFIVKFLSPEEQGYYYTFGSIIAIQVFFELGLTSIIAQFVAHEVSHIKETDSFYNKSRLASLLSFCVKWYSIFAAVIIIALILIGFFFFQSVDESSSVIEWRIPWLLLVVGTAVNFLISPISSFIEGLGYVKEIAKIRLFEQLLFPIIVWGGLLSGARLYVSGVYSILSAITFFWLIKNSKTWGVLLELKKIHITSKISYSKEIYPMQWRIALSWISGYFIFQLFNPVLFATEGPIIAGQMGMTLSALNSLQALTQSWISTKVPHISGLIALKKYDKLDDLFNKTLTQMLHVGALLLFMFVLIIGLLQYYNYDFLGMAIGERFLPFLPLCLMTASTFTMIPINCWATYLRSHKKEPLLVNSIVIGILCCISTVVTSKLYGIIGLSIGFLRIRIISLIWIRIVFIKKKNEWHK